MTISQQPDMIETSFKNWHVQENQLYKMEIWGGALIRAGALITANTICENNVTVSSVRLV